MNDKLRIERAIAAIGLGVVLLGCVVILWPFATSLLWATIIVFSTRPLSLRVEGALGGRTVAAAGTLTLLTTALLVVPIALLVLTLETARHCRAAGAVGSPPRRSCST
jgi:predicted PurR-regulated permease PerM